MAVFSPSCARNIKTPRTAESIPHTPSAAPSSVESTATPKTPAQTPSTKFATPEELADFSAATRRKAQAYLLYKGDVVDVKVSGYPEFSREYKVLEDGTIALTVGPPVSAHGGTLEDLRKNIVLALRRYVKEPQVTLALTETGPRMVTVLGDVPKPGRTPIVGQGTLIETLMASGWNYDPTRAHAVTLVREQRSLSLDLGHLFTENDLRYNLRLLPDDIIMLTPPPPVTIEGAVTKPGPYPVSAKGWLTMREALTKAGGITVQADLAHASIVRASGETIPVDLNAHLFAGAALDEIRLEPSDTLFIPHSREIGVYVLGMVKKPGIHRKAGVITAMQALALAEHTQFGALLSNTKLIRHYGTPHQEVIALDLDRVINKGDLKHDVALADGDVLFVPETATSDVLEFVNRLLGPLSGTVGTAASVKLLTAD